ncbi:MAG: PEP-CTERM sorting domain-containing protein [Hydrococcus sp. Prado102]|nr:PEP-CTERM sorting domain-containing protein [Hydrococcus sp. Prado102]
MNISTFVKMSLSVGTFLAVNVIAASANATTFTRTSPTSSGAVPTGVSEIGGIVLDLIGNNGVRVTSQLAASQLYVGFYNTGTPVGFQGNPGTIGIQTGFTSSVLNALGGGFKEAGIRFTLFDGDTASDGVFNDFDFNDNTLLVNGLNFGNWSSVNAQQTDSTGTASTLGFSGGGFRNNTLDTGWFFSNDAGLLSSLYSTLVSTGEAIFQVNDVDPFDNFYDFTQGIDSSLINVGQGPVVNPPTPPSQAVPEPASVLGLLALGAFGASSTLKSKKTAS